MKNLAENKTSTRAARVNTPKTLYCGECLMEHTAIVKLQPSGECLCCKFEHKPDIHVCLWGLE